MKTRFILPTPVVFLTLLLLLMQARLAAAEEAPVPLPSPSPSVLAAEEPAAELDWLGTFALGIPQPLQFGAEARCTRREEDGFCSLPVRAYVEGGWFFVPFGGGKYKITLWSAQVGVRTASPSGWFAGLGLGYRKATLNANLSEFKLDGVSLASRGIFRAHSWFVQPTVGWRFRFSESFFLQTDVGLQVPIFGSASIEFTPGDEDAVNLGAEQRGVERIGKLIAPVFTLFRLIWDL